MENKSIMSYKAFKEYFQSCPVRRCSAATLDAPLSSHRRFSSSLAAPDGEERKPPKASLKNKIAALDLLGSRVAQDQKKVVPSSSRPIPTSPTERSREEDGFGRKRSFLESSNEVELIRKSAEVNDESEDVRRNEKTGDPSSGHLRLVQKRSKSGPTLASAPCSAGDFRRTNSLSAVSVQNEKDDEGEEINHIVQIEDEKELGCDSEAGLWLDGPFEPLVLWPPAGEGTSNGVGEERIIQVPASINSRLFEHQREGVLFLYSLYRNNEGGVLGDDMGLGKTIQTIAFLAAILQKDLERDESLISNPSAKVQKQRCEKVILVICPTSVVQNWEQEFQAWGEFQVGICHGLQRELVLAKVAAKELEIVLTSHDTFRIHGDELCKINWDCVVVDEAHRLKNDKSQFYLMCSKLSTKRRYGLTGTVMQNKYIELFNVFDWATPRCLGTRDQFREYYSGPITQGQRISAPERFVTIADDRKKHLNSVLRRYHLRRTKQETIGHLMKGKEDNVVFCPMSALQKRVYKRVLQSPDFEALKKKYLPCSCGSPLTSGECCYRIVPSGVIWPYLPHHKDSLDSGCDFCPNCLILPCLTKLQQLSNHLELIKPNPKDDQDKQDKDYKFAQMAFGEDADVVGGIQQEQSFLGLSDTRHCGKMSALETLLTSWITQGDKVLLFSYSVKVLDVLERLLIRKGYCYSRLDGSIPMGIRQTMVEDFNHSPSKQIFLVSTRAGGLGLNLTSANRVVIFDPNWNPAHDLQAQDRSFRFGQNRHVTVYRLLAAGTLEELIYTRQIYKQQLFNIAMSGAPEKRYFEGVQGSKQHKGELFGLNNLFRDMSDDLFAEDIIENHEERFIRIQNMAALEDIPGENLELPRTTAEYAEDDITDEGYLTCEEVEDSGTPQLSTKEQDQGDTEEERKTQRLVQKGLTNAGVVYSHRNEDVVNLGPAVLGAKAHKRAGKHTSNVQNKANKQEKKVNENHINQKGNRKVPPLHQNKKLPKDIRAVKGKDLDTMTPIQPVKQDSEEGKRVSFAQLAESRGMSISAFSKWCLSATPDERAELF